MRGPGGGDAEEHPKLGGDLTQENGVGCSAVSYAPNSPGPRRGWERMRRWRRRAWRSGSWWRLVRRRCEEDEFDAAKGGGGQANGGRGTTLPVRASHVLPSRNLKGACRIYRALKVNT
jgi:hypothetical protein